ncbi:class I SAM-dependent methyltransferase [Teredinibacter sp. KSP-S5-2]|uniref:class I SAM-dependent methyltransferase n=1 Tax=Teredinibacter sp. KSP-S5-2 TaxID=3034506 RepID=UPI002934D722|nr:class I SAM-dependent methyltransferase [Teredinibacter sp. KSP-S5-2]WNO09925.1 class I SAM-dependent methyltransferase [Teredinibacter sp. KSP-S5-2]
MSDIETTLQPLTQALSDFASGDEFQESRRLFHGRGKTYEGLDWLVVDWFDSFVFITFFKACDPELEEAIKQTVLNTLRPLAVNTILLQRRYLEKAPVEPWLGAMPEQAHALRTGLKYLLSFNQQNLGFFLDIEPARKWLEQRCSNKRVLNLFAYTCTFSVVAKQAGAEGVVNIDLSKKSLSVGRANHKINDISLDGVEFFAHDIFRSWGKIKRKGPYDVVIIDPPSFQKGSFVATKDYGKVIAKMDELVSEAGCFLACLNAPEITRVEFEELIDSRLEGFVLREVLEPSVDFPDIDPDHSLKMFVYVRDN